MPGEAAPPPAPPLPDLRAATTRATTTEGEVVLAPQHVARPRLAGPEVSMPDRRAIRRHRRRGAEALANLTDPAPAASQRRGNRASYPKPKPGLVLMYDTTKPDPGTVERVIDAVAGTRLDEVAASGVMC